jgi:hypothetical protein
MSSWYQTVTDPIFVPEQSTYSLSELTRCPFARQVIYSAYHNSIFVRSSNVIYKVPIGDEGNKIIIYSTNDYSITHVDVSDNGELLLLLDSDNEKSIKIMHRNLVNILSEVVSVESVPTMAKFSGAQSVIASTKNERLKTIRFLTVNFVVKTVYQNSLQSNGKIISLLKVSEDRFLGATDNGEFYNVSPSKIKDAYKSEDVIEFSSSSSSIAAINMSSSSSNPLSISISSQTDDALNSSSESSSVERTYHGVTLIKSIGKNISTAEIAGKKIFNSNSIQTKARVFVGSRLWSNDRWDSGEINTNKTSIAYGGGDNLVAGQKYYVHVLSYNDAGGWSAPQIQEMVVPKY